MNKVLVVLNDGTDEIFNLHSYDVHCKEQVLYEMGNTFLTGGLIEDMFHDGEFNLENKYYDLFDALVKEWVTDAKFFMLIETDKPEDYHSKVDSQNELCEHLFNKADFVPWDEMKDKL